MGRGERDLYGQWIDGLNRLHDFEDRCDGRIELGVLDPLQQINHIARVEVGPIVEFDPFAQLECPFGRAVVRRPRHRQVRARLSRRAWPNQTIHRLLGDLPEAIRMNRVRVFRTAKPKVVGLSECPALGMGHCYRQRGNNERRYKDTRSDH